MKNKVFLLIVATSILSMNTGAQVLDTLTDTRDGKTYKTVKIGTQTWFAENLAFKADSGMLIFDNCNICGAYYNWEVAKNVCPIGWRLPEKEDFEELLQFFGGEGSKSYIALADGGISEYSIKECGSADSIKGIQNYNDSFFWSSTKLDKYFDGIWGLGTINMHPTHRASINWSMIEHKQYHSVRCIKIE